MTVLAAAWIFLLCASSGSFILSMTKARFEGGSEKLAFSFVLGYGLLGYLILAVGFSGFLYFNVILTALAVLSVLLVREEIHWLRYFVRIPKIVVSFLSGNKTAFLFASASVVILLVALGQSLLPPTAHDALCYHLYIPKRFVQEHRIGYHPYLVNSLFPFLIEMHYTLALLFGKPEMANIFHLFTAFGTFIGVFSLAKRFGGILTGLIAGMIFILTPGIFNQMTITYNDVGLVFFSFFAFYALIKAVEEENGLHWFALMGIFSGFALSVKYLALFHIAAISILISYLFAVKKIKPARFLTGLALYSAVTVIFSFIWYLRSYLHEGNPVYPFFPNVFGSAGKFYDFERVGFGKSLADFLLIVWRMTMYPQQFGGTWAQPGLCYLTFLPVIIIYAARVFPNQLKAEENKEIQGNLRNSFWLILSFSLIYFLIWFYTVQNLRFLFPLLPLLGVLIAQACRPFMIWLVLLLSLNAGFAVYHGKGGYKYLFGLEDQAAYLAREERTYALSQWVNQNIPPGSKILNAEEVRMFYFDPEMVREREFRLKTKYDSVSGGPEEVIELFGREGITHILLVLHEEKNPESLSPLTVRKLIANNDFKNRYLKLLHEESFGGEKYEIYQIQY